jgi:Ca2+-binding RTX toxin-like protein
MAIFTGFAAAVAMDLFFDPTNGAGPAGSLWSSTIIVQKSEPGFTPSVVFGGWPRSAVQRDTFAAFYVVEGNIVTPEQGPLTAMTGTVTSLYEYRFDDFGDQEPFWQVYVEKGIEAKQLLASPSLGLSMQKLFSGDDEILGSLSSDSLYGFKGNDKLAGSAGDDFYLVDSRGDKVIEVEGEGEDTLVAYLNYDGGANSSESVELFYCVKKCTTIAGNANNNFIIGNEAKNKLQAYDGKDLLYGVALHPLTPNANKEVKTLDADKINGGADNDLLFGLGGKDVLTGDSGADIFVFDTPPTKSSVAKINDFAPSEDRIGLAWNRAFAGLSYKLIQGFSATIRSQYYPNEPATKLRYTKLLADEFKVIADSKQLAALETDDRIIYEQKTGKIYYDVDGSGATAAIPVVIIAKNLPLTADAFLLLDEADAFIGVYDKETRQ